MRSVQVDTTAASGNYCEKCHKPRSKEESIFRHHKGNDGMLGRWSKAILGRYYKWLDCVHLCLDCHCTIHFIYEPYIAKWFNRSPRGTANFRKKLIEVCDKWLAGEIPSPVVPDDYRKKFEESLIKWRKERAATGSQRT